MISIIGAMVIYFFYNLGYAFLYGFYFGGGNDQISIFSIIINPVPFYFKSIIAVGVILLVFTSVIFIPLYRMLQDLSKKGICINFLILSGLITVEILSFIYIFLGDLNSTRFIDIVMLIIDITILPVSIFCVILYLKFVNKYAFRISLSLIYSMILSLVLSSLFESEYSSIFFIMGITFFPVGIFLITKVSEIFFEKKTLKIIGNFFLATLIAIIIWVCLQLIGFEHKIVTFVIVTLACNILVCLYCKIFKSIKLKNKIKREMKNETCDNKEIADESGTRYKKEQIKFITFLTLIVLLFGIFIYCSMIRICLVNGRMLRTSLSNVEHEYIEYEVGGEKTRMEHKQGNIVSQSGDIYYISTYPDRKLVTIKSKNVISAPYEDDNTKEN